MTSKQGCHRSARYKNNTGDYPMHFIREETLQRFVLRRLLDITVLFFEDMMSFQKAVYEQCFEEAKKVAKSAGVKSPKLKNGLQNLTGFSSVSMRTIYRSQFPTSDF